ncbi:MAG: lytic transglycosylase domain-containing protein [Spirochaetaceae bacterium]|nr:lytic transglycosylase domain-containing protein [Spirochaetaceae bacterium]
MLKNKIIALLFLSLIACTDDVPPPADIPSLTLSDRATLTFAIRSGYSFINTHDDDIVAMLHGHALGAAYYYSYISEHEGKLNLTLRLLASQITEGNAFREWAALRYAQLVISNDLPPNDEQSLLINNLSQLLWVDNASVPLLFLQAALYHSEGNYQQSLQALNAIPHSSFTLWPIEFNHARLSALNAAMLDLAPQSIDNFFFNFIPTAATIQTLQLIEDIGEWPHIEAYRVIAATADNTAASFVALSNFIEGNDVLVNRFPAILQNYSRLSARSGNLARARQLLTGLTPNLSSEAALYQAYLTLGLIERQAGNHFAAHLHFSEAFNFGQSNQQRDVALRNRFEANRTVNTTNLNLVIDELINFAPLWHNPNFYDVFLNGLLSQLVQARNFRGIYRLYTEALQNHASPLVRGNFAFTLARAIRAGIEVYFMYEVETPAEEEARLYRLYRNMLVGAQANPLSYASFLSHILLGEIPAPLRSITRNNIPYHFDVSTAIVPVPADSGRLSREIFARNAHGPLPISLDLYALGFFYYDLNLRGDIGAAVTSRFNARRDSLTTDGLRITALALYEQEQFLAAINAMTRARLRADFIPNFTDYTILYPRVYFDEMLYATTEAGVDIDIMFGLVRQESGFMHEIRSHAGAIGLAQLMTGTAGDMNHLVRITNPDLTDPLTNLRFGAAYFNWLEPRLDGEGLWRILLGYNAGPTRIRTWLRGFTDLPPELAVEAVPFNESRSYVKFVLTHALIFNYLYGDQDLLRIVQLVFPGLEY